MLRKVYMMPTPSEAKNDTTNSINQIVLNLANRLSNYGWEVVENPDDADIVAAHAGQTNGVHPCDVAHLHGFYPTELNGDDRWQWGANRNVVGNVVYASRVTVPSTWVADIVRREFNIDPEIVPWGINFTHWGEEMWPEGSSHKGYSLWNKTRADFVCDPRPVEHLAQHIQSSFISTFGRPSPNLKIIGRQPYDEMRRLVQESFIYIATTKETFGIGILEAMASGVPILGYRWGSLPMLVDHGVEGFLAEPGDLEGLVEGWKYCAEHREILGKNGRKRAKEFPWERTAQRFAEIYDEVFEQKQGQKSRDGVTVVIPLHNYAKYVRESIRSVLGQKVDFPVELIIVDDASIDDSFSVANSVIEEWEETVDSTRSFFEVSLLSNTLRQGVARTRNLGIRAGRFSTICCLDADDRLGGPEVLKTLKTALDANPQYGLVYGRLATMNPEDSSQVKRSEWPKEFDPAQHFQGSNQVPTFCMFRRKWFDRAGGYRFQYEPAEDADLWTRIYVAGAQIAMVTNDICLEYRVHDNSLSSDVRRGKRPNVDWLRHHPYARDNRFPLPAPVFGNRLSWPVRNYDLPEVAVIIPVSEYHRRLFTRALDSVFGQTHRLWECIVVDDTDRGDLEIPYAWVKRVRGKKKNASSARNEGVRVASAPVVTFLDADDMFEPLFLEKTLRELRRQNGRYIYSDWQSISKTGQLELGKSFDYVPGAVFNHSMIHSVNIVILRSLFLDAGGFDETFDSWEDVELSMKLASKGICGYRIPEPLFVYDYRTGRLREEGLKRVDDLKGRFRSLYGQYMGENAQMCNCVDQAGNNLSMDDLVQAAQGGDMIRVQYFGASARETVIGSSGQNYGRRENGEVFFVWLQDVEASPDRFKPVASEFDFTKHKTQLPPPPKIA